MKLATEAAKPDRGETPTLKMIEKPPSLGAEPAFRFRLCADDFGISEGVSRGILAALAAGRLSATSAMTTQPFWPRAARLLQELKPAAEIGLHLNLTLAMPLTAMPAFAPSGTLPRLGEVLRATRKGNLPRAEIGREIAAQIDAFGDCFGQAPAFIDGHQHVQVPRGLRQVLFDVLERKGLVGKLWLRDSGDRAQRIFRRGVQARKASVVAWLARGFAAEAAAGGHMTNDGFSGFSSFSTQRDYAADFARYLVAPGATHLVMCHPGHVDAELERLDPITERREAELAFLLSPRFAECLALRGAALAYRAAAVSH
jgi:chitin disaccharide deacetylase